MIFHPNRLKKMFSTHTYWGGTLSIWVYSVRVQVQHKTEMAACCLRWKEVSYVSKSPDQIRA